MRSLYLWSQKPTYNAWLRVWPGIALAGKEVYADSMESINQVRAR